MSALIKRGSLGILGRLFIGFSILIIPVLIITVLFIVKVNRIEQYTTYLDKILVPSRSITSKLDAQLYESQLVVFEWLLTNNINTKKDFERTWEKINETRKQIDVTSLSFPNEYKEKWEKLKNLYPQLEEVQHQLINLQSSDYAQIKILLEKERPLMAEMVNLVRGGEANQTVMHQMSMFTLQSYLLTQKVHLTLNDLDLLRTMMLSFLLILITLSVVVSYGLIRVAHRITKETCAMVLTLDELKRASDMQSTGVSEQASSINEITASLEEIDKSATQTKEKAQKLGQIAEHTSQKGQVGLEAVDQSIKGMHSIRNKVETIAKVILELSHQTQQVGEITAVVNTLALQSKMLALNASIEAAKAGEAGKGFGVVASEVKNLAEQSEQSTIQVQKILEDIRSSTERAVLVTEEGTKGVDQGTSIVEQMKGIIQSLTEAINQTMMASQQIEAAVRQESLGIEQITIGMNEINQVTTSFVKTVKQTGDSVNHLEEMATKIKNYAQGSRRKED